MSCRADCLVSSSISSLLCHKPSPKFDLHSQETIMLLIVFTIWNSLRILHSRHILIICRMASLTAQQFDYPSKKQMSPISVSWSTIWRLEATTKFSRLTQMYGSKSDSYSSRFLPVFLVLMFTFMPCTIRSLPGMQVQLHTIKVLIFY
jgi:hypothetical protein